ncbi:sensor histidine kinase [Pseudaquabacterium terrae]|uniref:sensor histidine kinase n=1 Tax=Pseudaquabacterium terrae TaxID=2732868 RepID=UPI0031B5EC2A
MSPADTDDLVPHLGPSARRRLVAAFAIAWLVFWALMAWVSVQEHVRSGGGQPWRRVLDETTSMLVASGVVVLQWRWAKRLDRYLHRPWLWFARVLAWLPLLAPLFVLTIYGLRALVLGAAGEPIRFDPWPLLMRHEIPKFAIFYVLFCGVHFGLRSYRAWLGERLRAERLQALTQQAQLAQLTQQLQPHFLFNALNTIASLIHDDPQRADNLLQRLAALLRAASDAAQRPEQALADELALVRGYAEIMEERFGERVRIEWTVDPTALDCRVPTLALQVLLENAFKHAVEKRRAATAIQVAAVRHEGTLRLSVDDDGGVLAVTPSPGVGLANLQRRLTVLHGAAAGLSLSARLPAEGGGVRAELWLPCAC